jgi:alkylated DNA repair dioxygenase AlkB
MELFNTTDQLKDNLLPNDGMVEYYGPILQGPEADQFYELLLRNIEWKNDEAVIFGKHILTKRKVAWYGDTAFEYTYSKTTKSALPWTPELLQLKNIVEQHSGEQYNSCLLNLYHNGQEGMAWHSDAEKNLIKHGAIGSLSFGAERKFAFKHKTSKEVVKITLQHGSLLVMKGITQTHWLHRLLTTTSVDSPRINLTFRTIRL